MSTTSLLNICQLGRVYGSKIQFVLTDSVKAKWSKASTLTTFAKGRLHEAVKVGTEQIMQAVPDQVHGKLRELDKHYTTRADLLGDQNTLNIRYG